MSGCRWREHSAGQCTNLASTRAGGVRMLVADAHALCKRTHLMQAITNSPPSTLGHCCDRPVSCTVLCCAARYLCPIGGMNGEYTACLGGNSACRFLIRRASYAFHRSKERPMRASAASFGVFLGPSSSGHLGPCGTVQKNLLHGKKVHGVLPYVCLHRKSQTKHATCIKPPG